MAEESSETLQIIQQAAEGDAQGWADLVDRYRDRLNRMVAVRLDRRMQQRVSASDIVQEAYLAAAEHLNDYLRDPKMPFFLWLRGITANKLLEQHRHHLGVKMRDAGRDVGLQGGVGVHATSLALANVLVGDGTMPDAAVMKQEMRERLEEALESLDPLDREVLSLRHFEQLSNRETAAELGIDTSAASKRYIRALKRLKGVLTFESDVSEG